MASGQMNLVSWMREQALPFWAANGIDHQYGGFVEQLNQDGSPSDVSFKRVRVQGRQLYSFSTAALLGWNKNAASIADHGFAFIKKSCRNADGQWVRKLTRDGKILDGHTDLYDTSFVMLGLATYYRLNQNKEALDLMKSALGMVRAKLSANPQKGYWQSLDDSQALRQNPHMHWFEAMLFCFEATQQDIFLAEAKGVYALAEEHIIDTRTGALRELFDSQWNPVAEEGHVRVEPGHHYEWTWLLAMAEKFMKIDHALIAKVLNFAEKDGVNLTTGLVYDQVSVGGGVTQKTHRLWVQTEALKAWLVRTDANETDRAKRINQIESNLFRYYLDRQPLGTWGDRVDDDGKIHDGPVPTSSMYHIMLCVTELEAWRSNRK